MKNEFVENDLVDAVIRQVYEAQYKKSDSGIKNGETTTVVTCPVGIEPIQLKNEVIGYFSAVKANADLRKYFISIKIQEQDLHIDFKWGHHAIIANGEMMFT